MPRVSIPEVDPLDVHDDPGPTRAVASHSLVPAKKAGKPAAPAAPAAPGPFKPPAITPVKPPPLHVPKFKVPPFKPPLPSVIPPKVTVPEVDPTDFIDDPGPTRAMPLSVFEPRVVPEIDPDEIYDDPGPTKSMDLPDGVNTGNPLVAIPLTTETGAAAPQLPKVTAPKLSHGGARRDVTGRTRAVPGSRVLEEIEKAMKEMQGSMKPPPIKRKK